MKIKKIFFVIALSSFLMTTHLDAGTIAKNKRFSSIDTTNTMGTSLDIFVFDQRENEAAKTISKIAKILEKTKIATGGHYAIAPEYRWEDGERSFSHYGANLTYRFHFSDKKEYEAVLDKIKQIKNVRLTQSPIEVSISDEAMTATIEKLELEAIVYGKNYSERLSHWLGDGGCVIKNITFASNNFSPMPLALMRSAQLDTSIPNSEVSLPIKKEKKIQLDASYIFECGGIEK